VKQVCNQVRLDF